MKYHVHVYKVSAKAEIEVEAESESEANTKALELKDYIEYGEPDCRYISMPFRVGKFEKIETAKLNVRRIIISSCLGCPFLDFDEDKAFCSEEKEYIEKVTSIPDWCPLKREVFILTLNNLGLNE